MRGCAMILGIAALSTPGAVAQECEVWDCEPAEIPPDPIWTEPHSWSKQAEGAEGAEGRIAVIVDNVTYPTIIPAVNEYVSDLANEGHPYVVYTFAGDPSDLRGDLCSLYDDPNGSLSGVVLIGTLPYLMFESIVDMPEPAEDIYHGYPADGYFMDLDGIWQDLIDYTGEYAGAQPGRYDTWDQSDAEIWVSRIKVDNLDIIKDDLFGVPNKEAYIINAYFARNHDHRDPFSPAASPDAPFDPGEEALTVPVIGICPERWRLQRAFESVTCDDDMTKSAYLDALTASPRNYAIHVHAHGDPGGHQMGSASVSAQEYYDADANVVCFWLQSCGTCNFQTTSGRLCVSITRPVR